MIFRPELVAQILNGRKTETRRLKCRYVTGKDYALQPGRGQKAVDRILITTIEQQTLDQLDHQAAMAEGFRDVEGFRAYWRTLHKIPDGRPTPWGTLVYVIRFELYRPKSVLVTGKDTPKFLAAKPGAIRSDYTGDPSRKMHGEPEVMDDGFTSHDYRHAARLAREAKTDQADFLELPLGTQLRLLGDHPNPYALTGTTRTARSVAHLLDEAA